MIHETRLIMGMPIVLLVHDGTLTRQEREAVFTLFETIDEKYSPYKKESIVSKLQKIPRLQQRYTPELAGILRLAEQTKRETGGYFDIEHEGVFDPSGIVKGWALQKAAELLETFTNNFYIEAGGDIQVRGYAERGRPWRIGIRNPFNRTENIAVALLNNKAIATSGTAIRGAHIYDPVTHNKLEDVASITVIAPSIIDADRMATAAFAMGMQGIYFLENLEGYEAFMITTQGTAIQTTGWHTYEAKQ